MPDTAGRDVAERLRQWRDERLNSEHVNPHYYSAARTDLVSEAAYAIERLRDELAHWRKKTCEFAKAYDLLSAELQAAKALRSLVVEYLAEHDTPVPCYAHRIALRALIRDAIASGRPKLSNDPQASE